MFFFSQGLGVEVKWPGNREGYFHGAEGQAQQDLGQVGARGQAQGGIAEHARHTRQPRLHHAHCRARGRPALLILQVGAEKPEEEHKARGALVDPRGVRLLLDPKFENHILT